MINPKHPICGHMRGDKNHSDKCSKKAKAKYDDGGFVNENAPKIKWSERPGRTIFKSGVNVPE